MKTPFYTEDVKLEPYWWEAAPRPFVAPAVLPSNVDVAIVGSGYTGLNAALTLARGGRSVCVFESGRPGEGASSRNGGGFGFGLRLPFGRLIGRVGLARAKALYGGHTESRQYLVHLVASEGIDCRLVENGRFTGAHAPGHYEAMGRDLELQKTHLGTDGEMVPRAEQNRVIGTDHYHGGRLLDHGGYLHPALYHRGLLDLVSKAGALLAAHTAVDGIRREGGGFTLATRGGAVAARDVIVATNGYTGRFDRWLRRRLIPIQSQIIATEPLAGGLVERLLPDKRMIGDTCNLSHYYRPSPDGERILFGGRAGGTEIGDPRRSGAHLYRRMTALFPDLAGTRVTHSWAGFIAYTFDTLPHITRRDGIHYAAGYCGSGVTLATYFGHKLGLRILGAPEAATPFDELSFPTRPLYGGRPWFLPPVMLFLGLRDRLRL